jgi:hypothetical protein
MIEITAHPIAIVPSIVISVSKNWFCGFIFYYLLTAYMWNTILRFIFNFKVSAMRTSHIRKTLYTILHLCFKLSSVVNQIFPLFIHHYIYTQPLYSISKILWVYYFTSRFLTTKWRPHQPLFLSSSYFTLVYILKRKPKYTCNRYK